MGLMHAEARFNNKTGHLKLGAMIQTSERGATCMWKESIILQRSMTDTQMYDVPLLGEFHA